MQAEYENVMLFGDIKHFHVGYADNKQGQCILCAMQRKTNKEIRDKTGSHLFCPVCSYLSLNYEEDTGLY